MLPKKQPNAWHRHLKSLSLVLGNTALVLIGLNLLLGIGFWVRATQWQPNKPVSLNTKRPGLPVRTAKTNGYQLQWVDTRAYEFTEPKRVTQILDDFADFQSRGLLYRPYVQFSDPPFQSASLKMNPLPEGYVVRATPEAPQHKRPLEVFLFGGSTTLGWNVADDQTLPAFLQKELSRVDSQIRITNFGRTNYSWFQESVLFQRLLHDGVVPDVALFLDGVNILNVQAERQLPHWTQNMARLWEKAQVFPQDSALPSWVPLFRLINHFHRKQRNQRFETIYLERNADLIRPGTASTEATLLSYRNTLRQIRSVAREFGVQPLFLWQPNRAFRCQTERYAQPLPDYYLAATQRLYSAMETFSSDDFINLSDACELAPTQRWLFVDDVHYSPWFNHFLAQGIAALLSERFSLSRPLEVAAN